MALHYDYVMIIIITMLLHRRELAKAIADCRQAVHNAHKAALKARQRFDNVSSLNPCHGPDGVFLVSSRLNPCQGPDGVFLVSSRLNPCQGLDGVFLVSSRLNPCQGRCGRIIIGIINI